MATKMIRIGLTELKTFRITCNCGKGVVEVPVEKLHTALTTKGECRFCGQTVLAGMAGNPLKNLADAMDAIDRMGAVITVAVEIPWPDGTAGPSATN